MISGSVSDDFNKKIQEWEDKKRKSIYRGKYNNHVYHKVAVSLLCCVTSC